MASYLYANIDKIGGCARWDANFSWLAFRHIKMPNRGDAELDEVCRANVKLAMMIVREVALGEYDPDDGLGYVMDLLEVVRDQYALRSELRHIILLEWRG